MTEEDRTPGNGGAESPGTDDVQDGESTSLKDQLEELKRQRAETAAEELDANISDLEKLISEADKADADYAKAYHGLSDQEARLKSEAGTLSDALKAALGTAGIERVKSTLAAETGKVKTAKRERDQAQMAVTNANAKAGTAAEELAQALARLDLWRKVAANVGKRLALAEALVSEIKTLRNSGRREEAYWKLALAGEAVVPGQDFLLEVLDAKPQLIEPGELRDRIVDAWTEFRAKRKASAKAAAALTTAVAELKAKETAYATAEKNLIKAITDALAEREDASDAA